jgi:DNA-directed RNA polymerase subunit RPC12/RpoP
MKWNEIEIKIKECNKKYWIPFIVLFVPVMISVIIMALFSEVLFKIYNVGIMVLLFVFLFASMIIMLFLYYNNGIRCPHCNKMILVYYESKMDILKNMHQCPYCQYKFED